MKMHMTIACATVAGALGLGPAAVLAAEVWDSQTLAREAREHAYVSVLVVLDVPSHLGLPSAEATARAQTLEAAVLRDVQDYVLPSSSWRTGAGLLGIRVSTAGIEVLRTHPAIKRVMRDQTRFYRQSVYDIDNRLARIEAELLAKGQAEVDILEYSDAISFRYTEMGSSTLVLAADARVTAASQRRAFLEGLPQTVFPDAAARSAALLQASAGTYAPTLRARVTLDGFFHLAQVCQFSALFRPGSGANPRGCWISLEK